MDVSMEKNLVDLKDEIYGNICKRVKNEAGFEDGGACIVELIPQCNEAAAILGMGKIEESKSFVCPVRGTLKYEKAAIAAHCAMKSRGVKRSSEIDSRLAGGMVFSIECTHRQNKRDENLYRPFLKVLVSLRGNESLATEDLMKPAVITAIFSWCQKINSMVRRQKRNCDYQNELGYGYRLFLVDPRG